MDARHPTRSRRSQAGIALLISIFVLLLICVVAIALIVASGTESALAGNYRSATGVYYAAYAGLEEARGRLFIQNPDYFLNTNPGFMPAPGSTLDIGQVRYIVNPVGGENVLTAYPDIEYNQEFAPRTLAGETVLTINSVSTVAGIQGPLYKWVRINPVTERSVNLDLNGGGGALNNVIPYYYDGTSLNRTYSGSQAFEITSLAVLPNGTQKILQYVVAAPQSMNFGAAVTLAGNNTIFDYPNDPGGGPNSFYVDGRDHLCNGTLSANPSVYGLGWTDSHTPDWGSNDGAHPAPPQPAGNFLGIGSTPSINNDSSSLSSVFQSVSTVEALILKYKSDPNTTTISHSATNSDLTSAAPSMSSTSPASIVVDNDLNLSGNFTGYGMLIVTGKLTYSAGISWNGIVLVLGQGWATQTASNSGGRFNGAVVVANSRFSNGSLRSSLGPSFMDFNNPNGGSFYYSTCWINFALPPAGYSVLSFHEISQ